MIELTGRLDSRTRRTRQDRDRSAGLRRDARHPRCAADGTADPDVPRRSVVQMQADALVRLCEHALGCPQTDLPLHGRDRHRADRPRRPRQRHRLRDHRRDHRAGIGRHRPADGRRRADHLLRPRRGQPDPGLGPHQTPLHPHPAARARRTRRRLRDVRGTTRAHQGPPHPMVGTGCRTHRPGQRVSCSASPVTTASTTTGGTSASTASAITRESLVHPPPPRRPRPAHPASADAPATTSPPEPRQAPTYSLQVLRGQGVAVRDQVGGRALEHDRAAVVAGARAEVDDPVGVRHDGLVVLDHDDAVAGFDEAVEHREHVVDVGEVQARRRLVEHVDRALLRHRDRELEPLPLAAGERVERLAERDVAEADVDHAQRGWCGRVPW